MSNHSFQKLFFIGSMLVGAGGNAFTQPARAGQFTLISVGEHSCESWSKNRQATLPLASYQEQSWVLGFLSGVASANLKGVDPLSGLNADMVAGWVDSYCRNAPANTIAQAAVAFVAFHPH